MSGTFMAFKNQSEVILKLPYAKLPKKNPVKTVLGSERQVSLSGVDPAHPEL